MNGGEELDRLMWCIIMIVLKIIECWLFELNAPLCEIILQKALANSLYVLSVLMLSAVFTNVMHNVDEKNETDLSLECILTAICIYHFANYKKEMLYTLEAMSKDWFNYSTAPMLQMNFVANFESGFISRESIAFATSFNIVMVMNEALKFTMGNKRFEGINRCSFQAYKKLITCVKKYRISITFAFSTQSLINAFNLRHIIVAICFLAITEYQVTEPQIMEAGEEWDKLVWPLKFSLSMFGCWPDRSEAKDGPSLRKTLRRFHRGVMLVLLIAAMLSTSDEVFVFWGIDMNETIEHALVSSAFSVAVLRICLFWMKHNQMLYILETMREDWVKSDREGRELLRDKCLLSYKLAKFFSYSVYFSGSTFIILPALEMNFAGAERATPYCSYFLYNRSLVSPYFEVAYSLNAITLMFGCSTITGATSFSLLATIHGAAKFALVQKDFQTIGALEWISNEKVGKCVRQHQQCIKFAEIVEEVINFLALAQFVVSTGLLCFAGFQMTSMMEDRTRLSKYASFLNAAITELFIFSYSGQSLKTESEDVADAVYSSNWVGSLKPSNVRLILMRSRKPCTITAGKFYDMSLESFLKVLSSSFSYFTVLLAMNEE